MRLFWEIAIAPVLNAAWPERIVEIGVDGGLTTQKLLKFVNDRGAFLEAIDPDPKIDADAWQRDNAGAIRFHRGLSLEVLPTLAPVGVALIDGDHNWYTVRHELDLLERVARAAKAAPPIVLLHDVGWPYGRRDLYYAPETIPVEHRQPHERRGLLQGRADLADDGFNAHLHQATHEHGPHNGVRTAVEDFVAESETEWQLTVVPGGHGLGILVPAAALAENGRLRD